MTIRERYTNREELRTARKAEPGAASFLLMRCGALLRLNGRDARPHTRNGWAGEGARPHTRNARTGSSLEKSKKRASAEILSSPLEPPFPRKRLIRMEI